MDKKEIIKMAMDIDGHMNDWGGGIDLKWDTLVEIVQTAIKNEREACADLCSRIGVGSLTSGIDLGPWDCAEQIRARGEK